MTDRIPLDPDTTQVIEILRGARRGTRDPDIRVTEILAALALETDEGAVARALERLLSNADTHR